MKRFVAGADREQSTLVPECLDDFIDESNPVRVIDAFVDALDLADLGFDGVEPAATGRPAYHPSTLLKLYIYGYLNRRKLPSECSQSIRLGTSRNFLKQSPPGGAMMSSRPSLKSSALSVLVQHCVKAFTVSFPPRA